MPTVAKGILLPSAAVPDPDPVTKEQDPPAPLGTIVSGGKRVNKYVALPTCCGIAGPLELPPMNTVTPPLPVPWTSAPRPAAGAAAVVAAKPRLTPSHTSKARNR